MTVDATSIRKGFVPRGNFVAMPLAFPSVTIPIDHDSSYVTACAYSESNDGVIFGGTSGEAAHLFLAVPRAPGGYVFHLGAVAEATSVVKMLITGKDEKRHDQVAACVNAPGGGRIVTFTHSGRFPDGIQEWSFGRPKFITLVNLSDETILDAHALGSEILCLTDKRLLSVSLADGAVTPFSGLEVEDLAIAAFGVSIDGDIILTAGNGNLLGVDAEKRQIAGREQSLPLASGSWGYAKTADNRLVAADNTGQIVLFDPAGNSIQECGKTLLAPVHALACLPDLRIYGLCGEGIGRFFYGDLNSGEVEDYGPVGAVLGAKRYAYTFCCSAVGKDGEIYFGENDRGGHLWIYFPPVGT